MRAGAGENTVSRPDMGTIAHCGTVRKLAEALKIYAAGLMEPMGS